MKQWVTIYAHKGGVTQPDFNFELKMIIEGIAINLMVAEWAK